MTPQTREHLLKELAQKHAAEVCDALAIPQVDGAKASNAALLAFGRALLEECAKRAEVIGDIFKAKTGKGDGAYTVMRSLQRLANRTRTLETSPAKKTVRDQIVEAVETDHRICSDCEGAAVEIAERFAKGGQA
jgi:hypothetical protein